MTSPARCCAPARAVYSEGMSSHPRPFSIRRVKDGKLFDETVDGQLVIPDAVDAAATVVVHPLARCCALPFESFRDDASAAIDAAPTAVRWDGAAVATDPVTGVPLRIALLETGRGRVVAVSPQTLPERAVVVPDAPWWHPCSFGYPGADEAWRVKAGETNPGAARVYAGASGELRLLPGDAAAADFVAPGDAHPYLRALRAEHRGPVGRNDAVHLPTFTAGGVSFAGVPTFGDAPVFLPGWERAGELVARRDATAGLYLVENEPSFSPNKGPAPGAELSVLYLHPPAPWGATFYMVSNPCASWRAASVEATARVAVAA